MDIGMGIVKGMVIGIACMDIALVRDIGLGKGMVCIGIACIDIAIGMVCIGIIEGDC